MGAMGAMAKRQKGRRDNNDNKERYDKNRKRKGGAMQQEMREIEALEARIQAAAPRSGTNPLAESLPANIEVDPETGYKPYVGAKLFEQLPISERTLNGLKDAKYVQMTEIQRAALPHALCGRDVLGAAKTGSGKTLAFLIPVIEKLYRLRWGAMDGVGALIISPTRELAVQIFEELRKVGKHHSLSGGLLIGGRKDVDTEKARVNNLNVLVCTPGRLLQHMDETVNFDCSQLQVLVLDEADRILDMGFSGTLNKIVAQIPKERQTFLFSATQTRSVQDLARLSLQDPEYLAVHAESAVATPARLQQTAMVVPLDQKLDTLWSFLKTHLRAKILVFLTSCKQVKFVHEAFKRLRPGIPVACLHGRMKQAQRLAVFFKFVEAEYSVLFATDIAARGLDFPVVDWVVQADCPEDVATYIHRVGRTARHTASGRSLLLLAPSEDKMLTLLEQSKIPIKVLKPNANKIQQVSQAIAGLLSKDPDLKYMAQKAFVTYLRSIRLQGNKEIFDLQKLPIAEYAASLGLPSTPRIRFLKQGQSKLQKNAAYALKKSSGFEKDEPEDGGELTTGSDEKMTIKSSKLDRLFKRKNADILSASHEKLRSHNEGDIEEDEDDNMFFQKKRSRDDLERAQAPNVDGTKPPKPKKKKLKIDPSKAGAQRVVFDDDGNAMPPLSALAAKESSGHDPRTGANEDIASAAEARYKRLKQEMKQRDKEDRLLERQRLRDTRLKKKQKLQKASQESEEDEEYNEREEEGPRLGSVYADQDSDGDAGYSSEEDTQGRKKNRGNKEQLQVDSLSLADQEALALKLLNSRS